MLIQQVWQRVFLEYEVIGVPGLHGICAHIMIDFNKQNQHNSVENHYKGIAQHDAHSFRGWWRSCQGRTQQALCGYLWAIDGKRSKSSPCN